MKDYALQLLTRMLEIYSPPTREHEISSIILDEMKKLGFKAWRDEVGNVMGEVGEGKPTLLLCGHMDTVPEFIKPRVEGNRLYGRGAVDAKGSLAAIIVSSSKFIHEKPNGKILVACVVEEEGLSTGFKHLLTKNIPVDYAIFGEPSGVENITIAYKGSLHAKISCRTETGHSSAPWLFENAVEKCFEVWSLIKKHRFSDEDPESRFRSVSSCLTKIEGGGSASTVPSSCSIHINFRVPPQLTPKRVLNEVERIVEDYKVKNRKVSVQLDVEDWMDAFEADSRSILVRSLSWAIRKVKHKQATLLRKTGSGDLNLLGAKLRIPAVAYGPGDSSLDHSPNENIDVQEFLESISVYEEAVRRLFELHAKRG